jgi:hypothetical protein
MSSGGPNPSLGRGAADFGQGFYVTSVLHQAQQWANQKVRNLPVRLLGTPGAVAAVLTFRMDRDAAGKYGDHLTFVIADAQFYDFVLFNRLGSATHGRTGGRPYDLVYGPVAAFPQTITYANCDQICFVAGGRALGALSGPTGTPSQGNPLFP